VKGFAVTTGYTGEDGFEVVIPNGEAPALWDALLAAGAKPCGLGARDTLRLEMCYPLNGSDLSPEHTPLEAGLGFFVDLTGKNFIGREALVAQKNAGLPFRLAAIAVAEKSPPMRPHYPVIAGGEVVAETSSGALSPSLGHGIAMAYLPSALAKVGQMLEIEVRGKRYAANVAKKPFLTRS
jgi:aminomethyltransferase